jgi:hypothetical protein
MLFRQRTPVPICHANIGSQAMTLTLKWFGVYGNGALVLLAGLVVLGGLIDGELLLVLIGLAVAGLGVFNIRVIRWAVALNSEEELLEAEVRKAELRQHLAELGEFASADPGAPPASGTRPSA